MDHGLRIRRLGARLADLGLDALLVTRLPNVRYLTGFSGSNAQVLVTDEDAVFYTDGRYEEQARQEVPDLPRVIYLDRVAPVERDVAARSLVRVGFEAAALTFREWQRLRDRLDGPELVPVDPLVELERRVKDAEEVRRIAAAQETADTAFEAVVLAGTLRAGFTERELALALEDGMRRAGADDKGFDTIVAFGENAAEPHHHPTDRELERGDVVKLDFGALVDGYHSDMTRTIAFGDPGEGIRDLHALVTTAQRAGIDAARAGAALKDVDAAARGVVEAAGRGAAFPHGLGHGVGLEIHEEPFFHWTADDVLPERAVVTVEPGVYLPGLGGVRIEDTIEVTTDAAREIPRSTKELVVL